MEMTTTENSELSDEENEEAMEAAMEWAIELCRTVGLMALFGIAIIFDVILMFMRKRKQLCLSCCNGYFALLVPANFLEAKNRRKVFCAAFALITVELLDQIFGKNVFVPDDIDPYQKFFVKLVIMAMNAVAFMPLVGTIHMGTVGSCIIGIFYMVNLIVYNALLIFLRLQMPLIDQLNHLLVRTSVISLCGLYLLYWFIKQIIKNIRRGPTNQHIISKYHTKYVKKLLNKRCSLTLTLNDGKMTKIKRWFQGRLYYKIPGFRYSLTILISCTCSFVVLTKLANWNLSRIVIYYRRYIDMLEMYEDWKTQEMPNIFRLIVKFVFKTKGRKEETAEELAEKPLYLYDFVSSQITIILVAVTCGSLLAYLGNSLGLLHMLKTYRENVINIYCHNVKQNIMQMDDLTPIKLLMGATQFAGYQVAYMIWGFIIQCIFYIIIFFVLGELIFLPLQYDFWFVFGRLVQYALPIIFVLAVTRLVLYLLVRFVFLQDNGKTMALNNRRGYFITMYIMFFYNIFAGVFSCLMRIMKCTVMGTIFVSRLDRSVFPRSWEGMDSAFRAYTCLLRLEALQCNPILRTFVDILLRKRPSTKLDEALWKYGVDEESVPNGPKTPKAQLMARNRWFVAVTLIHNPDLIKMRGKQSGAKLKLILPTTVETML